MKHSPMYITLCVWVLRSALNLSKSPKAAMLPSEASTCVQRWMVRDTTNKGSVSSRICTASGPEPDDPSSRSRLSPRTNNVGTKPVLPLVVRTAGLRARRHHHKPQRPLLLAVAIVSLHGSSHCCHRQRPSLSAIHCWHCKPPWQQQSLSVAAAIFVRLSLGGANDRGRRPCKSPNAAATVLGRRHCKPPRQRPSQSGVAIASSHGSSHHRQWQLPVSCRHRKPPCWRFLRRPSSPSAFESAAIVIPSSGHLRQPSPPPASARLISCASSHQCFPPLHRLSPLQGLVTAAIGVYSSDHLN